MATFFLFALGIGRKEGKDDVVSEIFSVTDSFPNSPLANSMNWPLPPTHLTKGFAIVSIVLFLAKAKVLQFQTKLLPLHSTIINCTLAGIIIVNNLRFARRVIKISPVSFFYNLSSFIFSR